MNRYQRDCLSAYLLVAPLVLLSIVFFFFPVIYSIILGFYDWNLLNTPLFVGLQNFFELFKSDYFNETLINTVIYSIGLMILLLVFGLILALMLNQKGKIFGVFQGCIFSSYLVSWVTIGLLWVWILDPQYGLLNSILHFFHIPGRDWLGDTNTALVTIIFVSAWKMIGYPIIIFLSGLRVIPDELYNAASIDGANWIQKFRHITWPLLSPTTLFLFITMLITSFQAFDIVKLMTQGGPVHSTTIYVYYIYEQAFMNSMRLGYASSAVTVFFFTILIMTILQYKMADRKVHYQ